MTALTNQAAVIERRAVNLVMGNKKTHLIYIFVVQKLVKNQTNQIFMYFLIDFVWNLAAFKPSLSPGFVDFIGLEEETETSCVYVTVCW